MKKITYKSNEELWKIERAAKFLGFKKIADCYWSQIFKDTETGYEFYAERDE